MRTAFLLSIYITLVAMFCAAPAIAEQAAREGEESFVVIQAGRVITLAGEEIVDGQIVLADGKIRLVGKDLEYPKSASVIEARNEVVMPGWIHPRTRWQLPSYARSGVHADRSPAQEVFLSEMDTEPLLEAGFTAACFYPDGTGIPGPGVVYRTAGPKEERKLGTAYLRVTMSQPGRDKNTFRSAIELARKELEKIEKARKEWEEKQKKAQEEAAKKKETDPGDKPGTDPKDEKKDQPVGGKEQEPKKEPGDPKDHPDTKDDTKDKTEEKPPETFTPPEINPAVKPFADWIRDKKGIPLLFELARASDLHHLDDALKTTPELPGKLFYLDDASSSDYHHVVDELGKHEAIVFIPPSIGQLPSTVVHYHLPAELALAGCTVAFVPRSDSASELRQLRPRLADLVRAGLLREDALKGVTLHVAMALGMEDRLGTIEKGKDADLVFFNGDPLAIESRVTRVMTAGDMVWEAPKQP
ncbi:MAG: amidohydrolase family protein [Pirellulales bacterium]|nr:amidohydrolase family protein [Pirellulales bacterium]